MLTLPQNRSAGRAVEVIGRLSRSGHLAMIAGGAVRDLILGREPSDFDVATSATPDQVASLFPHVAPVGARFGVVLVVVDGEPVQVATFRKDAVYEDGRRPVAVTFTLSPEEDARRRDFTVNGMFLDPESGDVTDTVGGMEDLLAGRIRTIGDARERFCEDRLRMLRAVRFACSLDFEIEGRTADAIREFAGEVSGVSGERIREELLKILTGPSPKRGLEMLRETGLLRVILPEVEAMVGVEQPPEFHPEGDVFMHTCLLLEHFDEPSPTLALAGLLHDVGKPPTFTVKERIRFDDHPRVGAEMAEEICRRLRMSRADTEAVTDLVASHLKFMDAKRMREAKLRRFLTGPRAAEHLLLHRADCLSSHRGLDTYRFCVEKRDAWLAEPVPPEPLVTGRDLIDLGMAPGPIFAEILTELSDLQLEGVIESREEALEYLGRRVGEGD